MIKSKEILSAEELNKMSNKEINDYYLRKAVGDYKLEEILESEKQEKRKIAKKRLFKMKIKKIFKYLFS